MHACMYMTFQIYYLDRFHVDEDTTAEVREPTMHVDQGRALEMSNLAVG